MHHAESEIQSAGDLPPRNDESVLGPQDAVIEGLDPQGAAIGEVVPNPSNQHKEQLKSNSPFLQSGTTSSSALVA